MFSQHKVRLRSQGSLRRKRNSFNLVTETRKTSLINNIDDNVNDIRTLLLLDPIGELSERKWVFNSSFN
jgi:hypothetical protein